MPILAKGIFAHAPGFFLLITKQLATWIREAAGACCSAYAIGKSAAFCLFSDAPSE